MSSFLSRHALNRIPVMLLILAVLPLGTLSGWYIWQTYNTDENNALPVLAAAILGASILAGLVLISRLLKAKNRKFAAGTALAESEERYRIVAESASDAILTMDEDYTILFVNPAAERIFGYSVDEMLGNKLFMLMPDILPGPRVAGSRQFVETGSRSIFWQVVEFPALHKDGHEIPIEITFGQINNNGKRLFTSVVRDITERKKVENEIQENFSLLTTTFEATGEGILVVGLNNRIVTYNHQYRELWQIPDGIIDSMDYAQVAEYVSDQLLNADDFIKRTKELNANPENKSFAVLEFKDGRFYEVHSHPRIRDGNIVGRVASFRDITRHRQAENSLRESAMLLAESQRITHSGSWELDLTDLKDISKNDLRFSDETYRIFGLKSGERKNLGEVLFNSVHPDDRNRAGEALMRSIERQQNFEIEHRIILPDGSERTVEGRAECVIDERTGKPLKLLGTVQDITRRKRAAEALRESENKMQTLVSSMSEGLTQANLEGMIEFANDRFCQMTHYRREELLGKNFLDIFLEEEERRFVENEMQKRKKGIPGQYEIQIKKKSGNLLWVSIGGAPVINADGIVTGTMGVFTDITDRKKAEEQLLHDAFHDGLTGLANRELFMDHLRLTVERGKNRRSSSYAVLFVDLDSFKVVNDTYGHTEGDKMLNRIARRLESAVRTGDLVARLGGDEFVVLLCEILDETDAIEIAERIQHKFNKPFILDRNEILISASIGIAPSTTGHRRAEDLIRDADIAMYNAKAKGSARYEVFDKTMYRRVTSQRQLDNEMERGIESGEFELHYQPIFDLKTTALNGFEALVRWKHPERGMLPPMDFIPEAEESGLIHGLGRWILNESCRQLREWQDIHSSASEISVSVNLSCKQFLQSNLADEVAETLETNGLDPSCLKLEITESHLLDHSERAVKIMNRLRALGVELSLDDFGTGYSSLSYLHRLPLDFLKIDRSFVSRMAENGEGEIVNTILKLAQNLKLRVIAEGIETADQLEGLKLLNCEYGQGFFFSKALKAKMAASFFERLPDKIANYDEIGNTSNPDYQLN